MRRLGFIHGSIVVASFNIFVGVISFVYNVILSKRIGAEGVGLFQMASSVLTPFLILTTAGIPTAVSRLASECKAGNTPDHSRWIFDTAVVFTLTLSLCLGLLLTFLTPVIALRLFGNGNLPSCLYLTVPAVVILSMTAVFRGYLYGLRLMTAAGISEIIEHMTRFLVVIGFLAFVGPVEPVRGAEIAVCGISVGELADLLWLIWAERSVAERLPIPGSSMDRPTSTLGTLLDIAGPLILIGLANTIMQSANAILIPQRLMIAGYTASAAAADYGRLAGMVLPLVFLPFTVTSALVINVIPNLSEQFGIKNNGQTRRIIRQAVGLTLAVATPLSVVYIMLAESIGIAFYHDSEVGGLIRAMGGATVLLALQHTTSGILSGIGKQSNATCHRLSALLLQLSTAYCLVGRPGFGICGYVISFYLYTITVCILDCRTIMRNIGPLAFRCSRRAPHLNLDR